MAVWGVTLLCECHCAAFWQHALNSLAYVHMLVAQGGLEIAHLVHSESGKQRPPHTNLEKHGAAVAQSVDTWLEDRWVPGSSPAVDHNMEVD